MIVYAMILKSIFFISLLLEKRQQSTDDSVII